MHLGGRRRVSGRGQGQGACVGAAALTHRERRFHVLRFHFVQYNALQIAHGLRGPVERRETLLLHDRTERLGRRGPGAALLLQAQIVERGTHGDHDVAMKGVLRRGDREAVALGERVLGGHFGGEVVGAGGHSLGLATNGHWFL